MNCPQTLYHNPLTCPFCNGAQMTAHIVYVYVEVRNHGSLGMFTWKTLPIEAESPEAAREIAFNEAHESGFETRGITLNRQQAWHNREYGTIFDGKHAI
jgi:hypothetical protein